MREGDRNHFGSRRGEELCTRLPQLFNFRLDFCHQIFFWNPYRHAIETSKGLFSTLRKSAEMSNGVGKVIVRVMEGRIIRMCRFVTADVAVTQKRFIDENRILNVTRKNAWAVKGGSESSHSKAR
mmetsp:Transcript_30396/g.85059  ORF Transcript_30396/g.85059 Transcript_30396/m.85059 type:complete len:125 (+) Transcript_30396:577-951(+)